MFRSLRAHFLEWAPKGSHFISFKLSVDGPTLKDVVALAPTGSPPLPPISAEMRAAAERTASASWHASFSTYLPLGDHFFIHCTIAPDHASFFDLITTDLDAEEYWAEKLADEKRYARNMKAHKTREANKAKQNPS